MINLKKSHLCETSLKILGHRWTSGGFWLPEPAKLEAIANASDSEISRTPRSQLYGLLNFFREYIPRFAELTEPLRKILGNDCKPWTREVTAAVCETVSAALSGTPWINFDPERELRVQTRVAQCGLAIIAM